MTNMNKLEWGVLFSVIASAASIVFSAGVIWTKLQDQEIKIAVLERNDSNQIDRLARIETKLDMVLGGGAGRNGGNHQDMPQELAP